eukprot:CAMPEP_0173176318 /NCGR_PEP_ID=MMETSP1141-20130122/4381_1 /TAXON_ID=483371 /ORGANISM="non described non described, Strain CCMP2298" /LENGTH=252 /DNA_ID=CAMNT_0014098619 /DNA_START=414 /DNA_END=1168 /DNA_ORIENTATION=+
MDRRLARVEVAEVGAEAVLDPRQEAVCVDRACLRVKVVGVALAPYQIAHLWDKPLDVCCGDQAVPILKPIVEGEWQIAHHTSGLPCAATSGAVHALSRFVHEDELRRIRRDLGQREVPLCPRLLVTLPRRAYGHLQAPGVPITHLALRRQAAPDGATVHAHARRREELLLELVEVEPRLVPADCEERALDILRHDAVGEARPAPNLAHTGVNRQLSVDPPVLYPSPDCACWDARVCRSTFRGLQLEVGLDHL